MTPKARSSETRRIVTMVLAITSFSVACSKDKPSGEANEGAPVPASTASSLPVGPSESQQQRFYHLAEGSEFVPYCALQVLAKERAQTVSQYLESYHLIADAKSPLNPLGLPVGVTVTPGPLALVGFNCAACHVAKIAGAPGLIIGGPSNFDIRGFYDGLIPWLSTVKQEPKRLRKIVGCVLRGSKSELNQEPAAAEASQEVAAALEPSAATRSPDSDLYDRLDEASIGEASAAARAVERATAAAAQGSPQLQALPKPQQQSIVRALVRRLLAQKELLKARIQALETVRAVGALQPTTVPGPGRVDAFMTALNLMNPSAELPMNSPVAFPHLWGISRLKWRHWDDNTNARLQRNMGQAIGVGAVTVEHDRDRPTAIGSTLIVPALIELEQIIDQIQPPRWPFAAVDPKLLASGQQLYQRECARCHEPANDGSMPELPQSEDPGTDEQRLENFRNEKAGAKPIDLLRSQLEAVELGSGATVEQRDQDPIWRTTHRYGVRSLRGVWATAPYLHNNSVPTLADLLTPPEQRPKRFSLDYSRYDTERVGFPVLDAEAANAAHPTSFAFDSSQAGNGNGGHRYGSDLLPSEKLSLLAYLKQL